jgi:hypothetical protein
MGKARTSKKRPGKKKRTRPNSRSALTAAIDHAAILLDTVCMIAGSETLIGDPQHQSTLRLRAAVTEHDTELLFETLMEAFSFQGISDDAVLKYMDQHGRVTWRDIERAMAHPGDCSKLISHWAFHGCGYEKASGICAEPDYVSSCPLPHHDLRNGRLNQTAYSLHLFIRDVADGDLVGWIDNQLRHANKGTDHGRLSRMRESLIGPLRNVFGVSDIGLGHQR